MGVVRKVFKPALRLFRETLLDHPDPVALRAWAVYLDLTLAPVAPDAELLPVALPHCMGSWFKVEGADQRRVILYLHGGAFLIETPRLHGAFLARLAKATQRNALMPHYRLAPEHPFPAAPDDALDAYRWLLEQGYEARDIVIAGDSAGGNLALGLLQRLKTENLPQPACAIALSPLTDGLLTGGSIRRNDGLDPMFTASGFRAIAPLYIADPAQRGVPLASPLYGDCSCLAPLLLMVGSSELLLDDSVRFALRCPGADLQVWHDVPHVFPLFDFLPEAAPALEELARFIVRHDAIRVEPAQAEPGPSTREEVP